MTLAQPTPRRLTDLRHPPVASDLKVLTLTAAEVRGQYPKAIEAVVRPHPRGRSA